MNFIECIDCGTIVEGATQRRRCTPCAIERGRSLKTTVTTLARGERVPEGEPRRYLRKHGYVELRWTVARRQQVRIYEHQVVDGVVTHAEQVHHKNHIRDDNRPENLEHLSQAEHHAEHNDVQWWAEADRLYATGLGTYRIARIVDRDPATVWRALVKFGTQIRTDDRSTASIRRWRHAEP